MGVTGNDTNTNAKEMTMKAAAKYKFAKVNGDEDARDVLRDGQVIGRIHRTWTRLGGWGWSHRIIGQSHRTMTDAATDMERRAAR